MRVSDCCGCPASSNGDSSSEDYGICPDCKEHCNYIDDEAEEGSLIYDMQELKKLLDNHKKLTNE